MPKRLPLLAVVEDDVGLCTDLVDFLRLRGFRARGYGSAEAFYGAWPAVQFDLLLLDVALPGASGLEIAQRVRAQASTGIIVLTALDANADHLAGLLAGADIFLSKRSSLEVIEAACRSVLRRLPEQPALPSGGAGQWYLDRRQWRLLTPTGLAIPVTQVELDFLAALLEHPGQAVSRAALLARLGKPDTLSGLRNLDNAASRLRRKVEGAGGGELPVRSSYGRGYTFAGSGEVGE